MKKVREAIRGKCEICDKASVALFEDIDGAQYVACSVDHATKAARRESSRSNRELFRLIHQSMAQHENV